LLPFILYLIKIWRGWVQPDICPDCGGKLEEVKEEKEIKENI